MNAAHTPAFPAGRRFEGAEGWQTEEGMTLRDYFAAKAMQGICASGPSIGTTNKVIATEAYQIADAMLEARK